MSNTVRVRLLAADVDLHCEFVSAAESPLPWKLLAVHADHQVGFVFLPEARLLWKLLALPDLDHVDGFVLPESRLLWKLPFFWQLKCYVPVMFFFLVASYSIPNEKWVNWKHSFNYLIRKDTCSIVLLIFGKKWSLFKSVSVIRGSLLKM